MNMPFTEDQRPIYHVDTPQMLSKMVARWRESGEKIAFVPTMGALHAGHMSLIARAKQTADKVVVSIYVNPTQFAPHEDFDSYPRDVRGDLAQLQRAGADLAYTPDEAAMYPDGRESAVKAGSAAAGLETDFRPHFFDGVVNVVYRLFQQVRPDAAIFGEKDFQQLQVIREMVAAQDLSIEIIGAEIARDEHGLALSSRNAYLSAEELEIARMLNQILYKAAFDIKEGIAPEAAEKEAEQSLLTCGFDKVDYVSYKGEWNRVLVAAWLGKTRLIDNCGV